MRILLLGKNGQVGRALQNSLMTCGELIAIGRDDLDLVNLEKLSETLNNIKPDIIVNASAYTSVDKAESFSSLSYMINTSVVKTIAEYSRDNNALFIHYSTDYVFDGTKSTSYLEDDKPNPLNVYGKSKLAGENAILDSKCLALIFRTSWVISTHGNNFIKTILRLAQNQDNLNVVNDQFGSPTSAALIAEVTIKSIIAFKSNNIELGVYNLTASGYTTWYKLAVFIINRANDKGINFRLKQDDI